MNNTAYKLIKYYKGETDGFTHVKESHWENNHLLVWLDTDYLRELCDILPYSYFENQITCILCYNGDVCITKFDEILKDFGINAEEVEPKEK